MKEKTDESGQKTDIHAKKSDKNTKHTINILFSGLGFAIWFSWMFTYYLQGTFAVLYSSFTLSQFLGTSDSILILEFLISIAIGLVVVFLFLKLSSRIKRMKNIDTYNKAKRTFTAILLWVLVVLIVIFNNISRILPVETFTISTALSIIILFMSTLLIVHMIAYYIPKNVSDIIWVIIVSGLITAFLVYFLRFSDNFGSALIALGVTVEILLLFRVKTQSFGTIQYVNTKNDSQDNSKVKRSFSSRIPAISLILIGFAYFLGLSGLFASYILININLNLLSRYITPMFLAIFIEIGIFMFWRYLESRILHSKNSGDSQNEEYKQKKQNGQNKQNDKKQISFIENENAQITLLYFSSIILAVTIVLGYFLNQYAFIIGFIGGGIVIGIWLLILISKIIKDSGSVELLPGLWRFLIYIVLAITIGFLVNGIKASLIYTLTFLEFSNGKIIVRTNFTSALNYDIPTLINIIVIGLSLIVIFVAVLLLWIYKRKKYRKEKMERSKKL